MIGFFFFFLVCESFISDTFAWQELLREAEYLLQTLLENPVLRGQVSTVQWRAVQGLPPQAPEAASVIGFVGAVCVEG